MARTRTAAAATRTDKINQVLRGLRVSSPEIIGSCVVNRDGLIIAASLPAEVDDEIVGGMAAAILGVGEQIASNLMSSVMDQTYIRSPNGYVIINAAGEDSVLVLLVTAEAKLGLIFLEIKQALPELARIL